MDALLSNSIVKGAVSGAIGAAAADIAAFRSWKKWDDLASYDWGVASFRWVQGAALGALTGLGYGALVG